MGRARNHRPRGAAAGLTRDPGRGRRAGLEEPGAAGAALIWLAYAGLDRMLGYGLEYGSGFGDTHLRDRPET
ncbi:DUF4260 family protein [Methylobacterium sp. CM6257]